MLDMYHLFRDGELDPRGNTNPVELWKRTPFRGKGIPHPRTQARLKRLGYEVRKTGTMAGNL